jgi:hypothetical protein
MLAPSSSGTTSPPSTTPLDSQHHATTTIPAINDKADKKQACTGKDCSGADANASKGIFTSHQGSHSQPIIVYSNSNHQDLKVIEGLHPFGKRDIGNNDEDDLEQTLKKREPSPLLSGLTRSTSSSISRNMDNLNKSFKKGSVLVRSQSARFVHKVQHKYKAHQLNVQRMESDDRSRARMYRPHSEYEASEGRYQYWSKNIR